MVKNGTTGAELAEAQGILSGVEGLFDHIPEIVFFLKDRAGRYLAVNQSLVRRCGCQSKQELIGRLPNDVFPPSLAERFAAQDEEVIRTGRPILDRLELHWYAGRRAGWCLTTKFPWRGPDGKIQGLMGISRDLRAPADRGSIPPLLTSALEYLEQHFDERVSPAVLAARAGLSPLRFARLIKKIFRLTPVELIAQTRLAEASRLLLESDKSVAEIAHRCGFTDHSAFTRAFRAATGVTPTQYRRAASGL